MKNYTRVTIEELERRFKVVRENVHIRPSNEAYPIYGVDMFL